MNEQATKLIKNMLTVLDNCVDIIPGDGDGVQDDIQALNLAITALEKQIPKKIYHKTWADIDGVPYDLCPNCENNLCTTGLLANRKGKYCSDCGQKLDWEESE